jgi:hypothetical protein
MYHAMYPRTGASMYPRLAHEVYAVFLTNSVSRTMHRAEVERSRSRSGRVEVVSRVESVSVIE